MCIKFHRAQEEEEEDGYGDGDLHTQKASVSAAMSSIPLCPSLCVNLALEDVNISFFLSLSASSHARNNFSLSFLIINNKNTPPPPSLSFCLLMQFYHLSSSTMKTHTIYIKSKYM